MRRSASEIIRHLEMRVARLEKSAIYVKWDEISQSRHIPPVDIRDMFRDMARQIRLTKKQSLTVRSRGPRTTEIFGMNITPHDADIIIYGPSPKVSGEIMEKLAKIAKPYGFDLTRVGGPKLILNHPSGYEFIVYLRSARDGGVSSRSDHVKIY